MKRTAAMNTSATRSPRRQWVSAQESIVQEIRIVSDELRGSRESEQHKVLRDGRADVWDVGELHDIAGVRGFGGAARFGARAGDCGGRGDMAGVERRG